MVKRTSTEARREEIADAVLQVIRRDGIGAASVRTVADEAGLSTGSLRHFFGTQSELLLFAMELVTRRVHERIPAIEFTGDLRADARLLAEQFVPLDADRRGEMDVWQAFVVAARTDPALAEVRDRTDREMYEGFLRLVGALHDAGLLAPHRWKWKRRGCTPWSTASLPTASTTPAAWTPSGSAQSSTPTSRPCSWMGTPCSRTPSPVRHDGPVVHVIDIADPADPRLGDYRDLNSSDRRPDLPGGKGLVIAEGVLVVQRMLASRFTPNSLLGVDRRLTELSADLEGVDVPFYRTTADVMAQVVGFHLNRGVLAAAHRPPALDVEDVLRDARTVAVLEGVNDHENIGSMFRNAAGLGVDAILFGASVADPLYRRAVRVSMGHALRVPFAQIPEWPRGLNILRDRGFQLISLTPNPAAPTLAEAMTGERVALLLGAEGPGLTEDAMRVTDVRARIPMSAGTDSLNVATAAAMAFYERIRTGS